MDTDFAGNILSINQYPGSTLQVLQVCPNAAPVGSAVTIWGTGFSSSASVAFNGTSAASVTFVSPNQLIATVPSGATSGLVSVTPNGGSKVNSPSTFNIGPLPPQISGISGGTRIGSYTAFNPFPFYGSASTAAAVAGGATDPGTGAIIGSAANTQTMTITGSGFDTTSPLVSTKNKVWFGGRAAQVISASSTSLTVNVPVSGSVIKNGTPPVLTVSTPSGTSAPYNSQTLLISPAGISPFEIHVKVPSDGTCNVTAGVDTTVIDAATDALTVGGPQQQLSFSSTSTFQHFVAYVFPASAGTMLNAQVSVSGNNANHCGPSGTSIPITGAVLLIAPDGSEVAAADLGGLFQPAVSGTMQEFWKAPAIGTYTLLVQNSTTNGGATATASVAQVPSALPPGTLTLGSSASEQVAGYQSASYTFNVPAGSSGRATLTTTLASAAASPFVVSITAPDGFTQVYSNQQPSEADVTGIVAPGQVDFSGPVSVPSTTAGTTYTIKYQSLSSASSQVTFALASLPSDIQATGSGGPCSAWPTSGSTTTCSGTISAPGQAVFANLGSTTAFASGNTVGTLQTAATNFAGCYEVLLTDTALNQQFYRSVQCGASDFSYALTFPNGSVGPYLVQAFGMGQNVGTLQFTLSTAPAPTGVTILSLGSGSPKNVTFTSPGQVQTLGFKANTLSPGQWLQLTTNEAANCYIVSMAGQGSPALPFEMPNQPFATSMQCATGPSGSLNLLQLPQPANGSNTYFVSLIPVGGALGSINVSAAIGSAPAPGTVPINGSVYDVVSSSATSFTSNFVPTVLTNGYVDVVTTPDLAAGSSNNTQSCYDVQVLQSGKVLFDSVNQVSGYQVGTNPGCTTLDATGPVSLNNTAAPYAAKFAVNSPTGSAAGSFGQTVYNYGAVAAPTTLALAGGGPIGVGLPSTLPGQPVTMSFSTTTTNSFADLAVGLDLNLAAFSAFVTVTDITQGANYGRVALSSPITTAAYKSGAFKLPNPGDTYQVVVSPEGDAVGQVSVGVNAQ